MKIESNGDVVLSPSDLTGHLACQHLTTLNLEVQRGTLQKPQRGALHALIAQKGDEHERNYLDALRASGVSIVEIAPAFDDAGFTDAHVATMQAMRDGAEVIYQATFVRDGWRGRADFLRRVEQPSSLGDWSYEPYDTKFAFSAKPSAPLQLAWYAAEIEAIQGLPVEHGYLVLRDNTIEQFRTAEAAAELSREQTRLAAFVKSPEETYPRKCTHCAMCVYNSLCTARREEDDVLTEAHGMRHDWVSKFEVAGIKTLTDLAEAPSSPPVAGMRADIVERLQDQARLQRARTTTGAIGVTLLEPVSGRGFGRLPEPNDGDLFFDMEGDPFFSPDGGLEFLFGVAWRDGDGSLVYRAWWAESRDEEKAALQGFVDFVQMRRERHPGLHVYHYAHYEGSTLDRLMRAHATREAEIHELLHGGVLVDLLKVVREALRAGVPSYSIKEMERACGFVRTAPVGKGNDAVVVFEAYLNDGDRERLASIEAYNREDCKATLALRDWLVEQKLEAERIHGVSIPWLSLVPDKASGDSAG